MHCTCLRYKTIDSEGGFLHHESGVVRVPVSVEDSFQLVMEVSVLTAGEDETHAARHREVVLGPVRSPDESSLLRHQVFVVINAGGRNGGLIGSEGWHLAKKCT